MNKRIRMSTMLRLFFIFVVMAPVLLTSFILLEIYERDIIQQNSDRSLQTSEALAFSVQQEIKKMLDFTALIGVNEPIIKTAMNLNKGDSIDKVINNNKLITMLEGQSLGQAFSLQSIMIFLKDGSVFSYLNDPNHDYKISSQVWYETVRDRTEIVHFIGMQPNMLSTDDHSLLLLSAISPKLYGANNQIDMIVTAYDTNMLDNILRKQSSEFSDFHIISESGDIITSYSLMEHDRLLSDNRNYNFDQKSVGTFIDRTKSESKLVTYSYIDNGNWYVIEELFYDQIMQSYTGASGLVWFIAIVIGTSFILISFYFVSNVIHPIHHLNNQMKLVTMGDLDAKWEGNGSFEIEALGDSFNVMTLRLKESLEEREKQEQEKLKAEFAALQSQINPHFLINTLNTIKYMAFKHGVPSIRSMTHALTQLIASTFNRGGIYTTIEEEMEYLQHYLYIMEIGFDRTIRFHHHVDPSVQHVYILRMLLQPIVENSVIHGLKGLEKGEMGEINIYVLVVEGQLRINISDNGVGFFHSLKKCQDQPMSKIMFSGMGNQNVLRRIQLHYGMQYGLEYDVNTTKGTTVIMSLPLMLETDAKEHLNYI